MKFKKILKFIFIVPILCIIFNCNTTYGADIKKGKYSEKYLEWLNLSEEEKNNTIAPLPINIRKKEENKGFAGKIKSIVKSISIPSSYDLREHINIEVRDQKNTGQCWAIAASTSLETYLALHNEDYNFSTRHMDYETSNSFTDGVNNYALDRAVGSGGYGSTAFTYYSRGSGPILEEDMPFEDNEIQIPLYELPREVAVKKVDNMVYFSNIFKRYDENNNLIYEDADEVEYSKDAITEIRNQIKEHIMTNGGISVDIYAPNDTMYYNATTHSAYVNKSNLIANHAVTIIGWDDNYSKTNFKTHPSENGAYIVLNSWGTEWGDNGIYYVSYEDFLIESQMKGVEGISNINYDSLYQHDISEMQNVLEYKYGANIFTAKNDEKLTEILVGSLSEQECNIYVNTENENLNIQGLTKIANKVKLKPGYNTIKLNNQLHIEKGNKFAIVVEITSEDDIGIGIEDNNEVWFGNAISNKGESFVSENGIDWEDIYDSSNMMNLSVKAYTQTDVKNFIVSDISGRGYANIGGKFSFTIETSYIYSQNTIGINIINSFEENVTERFIITGNEIRGKGAFVKIECPNDIEQGQYEVLISEPNNNEIISKIFQIGENNGEFITAQFEDETFWNYVKSKFVDAVTDSRNLTISAKKTEFEKIRNMPETCGKEITDITGIEYLTNLESINLNSNNITDITPLSNLQHLNSLNIEINDCVDFSPLSNLSSLKELGLGGNDMSNGLSFLQNLNNLEKLRLHACEVPDEIDISYIFNLSKLKYLDLTLWKWITEEHLQGIRNLSNMEILILSSCNIGNIDFIEGLHLRSLWIGNATRPEGTNHISDISIIRNMTTLQELNISRLPEIQTLNDLENLYKLDCLWCQDGKLRDATALDGDAFKDKTFWSNLWLSNNYFDDEIVRTNETMIIEIPKIIQQACNENSLLYSASGVDLYNCEWEEFGKSVKIKSSTRYISISINSGYASGTWYNVSIIEQQRLLEGIEILIAPRKTNYTEGENFDDSGMGVVALYNDGSSKKVTDYIILDGKNLTEDKTSVTISYTEGGITKLTTQAITVSKQLKISFIGYSEINKDGIKYVDDIVPSTTLGEMLVNIETNGTIIVYKDSTEIIDNKSNISTGMKIKIFLNNENSEFITVVTGDVNGDGNCDIRDVLQVNKHRLNKTQLTKENYIAGDFNKDDKIDVRDLMQINKYRLGKTNWFHIMD